MVFLSFICVHIIWVIVLSIHVNEWMKQSFCSSSLRSVDALSDSKCDKNIRPIQNLLTWKWAYIIEAWLSYYSIVYFLETNASFRLPANSFSFLSNPWFGWSYGLLRVKIINRFYDNRKVTHTILWPAPFKCVWTHTKKLQINNHSSTNLSSHFLWFKDDYFRKVISKRFLAPLTFHTTPVRFLDIDIKIIL